MQGGPRIRGDPRRSAYNSNGDAFLQHGWPQGHGRERPPLDQFPSPDDLWSGYRKSKEISDVQEHIATMTTTATAPARPSVLPAVGRQPYRGRIACGENRILLVATLTGMTYTAFQIIGRLWKSGAKNRLLFLR